MKTILTTTVCLLTLGCASPHGATKTYLEKDKELAQVCFGPITATLSVEAQIAVDQSTGSSPWTRAMACYAGQLKAYADMSGYQHKTLLYSFADYGVNLYTARDRGAMDMNTANAAYSQTAKVFIAALGTGDDRLAKASRQDFFDRLANAGAIYSNTTAEQDRQRRANRPVNCHLVGVYEKNTVVCN